MRYRFGITQTCKLKFTFKFYPAIPQQLHRNVLCCLANVLNLIQLWIPTYREQRNFE